MGLTRWIALAALVCCVGSAGWAGPARAGTPSANVKHWRYVGGQWSEKAGALSGEVSETARGFALADDAPFAYEQTAEVKVVPERRIGASWSAAGLCLWEGAANYWRLALVESPDGRSRYAELLAQADGQGVGEAGLRVLDRDPKALVWRWGEAYRLKLTLARDRITGEVFGPDGQRVWHVAYELADPNLPHFCRPALGVQGMHATFRGATVESASGAPRAAVAGADLKQDAARSAWLSLPLSRLVVNPTMAAAPAAPPSLAPSIPVNLAYYCGEQPVRLPGFWAWLPASPDSARDAVRAGPAASFQPEAAPLWQADRAHAAFTGAQVRLTVDMRPFGSLSTEATADLDATPYLIVSVPRSAGGWALKVNPGADRVDTYIQHDTPQAGAFVYDLRRITGWHGRRTFRLILFALGAPGDATTFSEARFAGAVGSLPTLAADAASWYPHQLTAEVKSDGKSVGGATLRAESALFLPDASTVAQRLRVTEGGAQTIVLTGQTAGGPARWDPERRAVLIEEPGFRAAIALGRPARWLGSYRSYLDLLQGRAAPPDAPGPVWALALEGVKSGEDIVVAARFEPSPAADLSALAAAAARAATPAALEEALRARAADWDRRLSAVPHPLSFALHFVDPRGATPDAMRRAYYRAWAFVLSDTLPPMPENGYPCPQAACGKPSLWGEGAPHARASAQWESFIAMQLLAQTDPDTAWSAFEGMMSLVDASGRLAGEGLPSRHAQTAWVLYSLTGNRQRLSKVYPALRRLLLWKAADPRWLYKNSTPPDQKDAEFVLHALMDMEYARRIARALDMGDEDTFWQGRIAALAADFHRWFWDAAGRSYRLYRAASGRRDEPDRAWNIEALALPPSVLRPTEKETLLRLYRAAANPSLPFMVSELAAFPKYDLALRGIWQYGTPIDAARMAEAAMRDLTLAGEFSENYTQSFPPVAAGVTPDVFGAALMISGALWHNGIETGDGPPNIAPLPGAVGIRNLRARGGAVDVVLDERDGKDGRLEIQGGALKDLRLPAGVTSSPLEDGTPRWVGPIPPAPGMPIEPRGGDEGRP